ncbi:uncharacterized protein LOC142504348 [Primulina tabacum]|uniref:uncharacterized protein LOC142504348 n=1 Tax=Primulina tabacum TaxID=48773 RepID=UPI003F5919FD
MIQRFQMDLLKDYDSEIQYHPRKVNIIADTLSCKTSDINLSSIHVSQWREDICTSGLDFKIQGNVICVSQISIELKLIQIVKSAQKIGDQVQKSYELVSQEHQSRFTIHSDDSLCLNGRFVVPDIAYFHKTNVKEAHCTRYSIHHGVGKYIDLLVNTVLPSLRALEVGFWVGAALPLLRALGVGFRVGAALPNLDPCMLDQATMNVN